MGDGLVSYIRHREVHARPIGQHPKRMGDPRVTHG